MKTETRADDMPRVRDEVAAQLRRLADLVQNDRWEEAERLAPAVTSAYSTCCNRWRSLKQRRAEERQLASMGVARGKLVADTIALGEQLEANRADITIQATAGHPVPTKWRMRQRDGSWGDWHEVAW
jgi:hypothetical protein